MSAEVATQRADKPPEPARLVKSNRRQVVLFALLTLILTIATVWGGRIWLKDSETLVFAVGDANGPEARFAAKLATVLRSNASRLRLKIVSNADNAKALAQFHRRQADLAVRRTDAKIPPPAIHDDDLDTVGLQWLLVAQSKMSTATAGDLARAIYENKAELALEDGFASKIEPADTDKDAFVIAHQGAAEYINDETKSFMDRYSDMMYLGAAALSVIRSIFAAIYIQLIIVAPENASELATAILDIGERMEHATSLDTLDALQDELEAILRGAVVGLRDGTISTDGLETFKLGYEFVRDELSMRRESLKRHAGHEDNEVIVKSAQSA